MSWILPRWLLSILVIMLLSQAYGTAPDRSSSRSWCRLVRVLTSLRNYMASVLPSVRLLRFLSMPTQHERDALREQLKKSFRVLYDFAQDRDIRRQILFATYSIFDVNSGVQTSRFINEFSQTFHSLDHLRKVDLYKTVSDAMDQYYHIRARLAREISRFPALLALALTDHRHIMAFRRYRCKMAMEAQKEWRLCHDRREQESPPVRAIISGLRFIIETVSLNALGDNLANIPPEAISYGRDHLFDIDVFGKDYTLDHIDQFLDRFVVWIGPPNSNAFDALQILNYHPSLKGTVPDNHNCSVMSQSEN